MILGTKISKVQKNSEKKGNTRNERDKKKGRETRNKGLKESNVIEK